MMNSVNKKDAGIVKKAKKVLTLFEKNKILDCLDKKETVASVARKFNLNESSVRTIRQNKDKIRKSIASSVPSCAKTVSYTRSAVLEKTEKALVMWIEDQTQKKVPLSSAIIREKSTRLHDRFLQETPTSSSATSFNASKGWFENFKKRHSLHNLKLQGESASADINAAMSYPTDFSKLIKEKGYLPEQVFNADETGLFWKKMPNRTFLSKEEKTAPGYKAAKDRLTLLLCSNASGDCCIKPLLVYKSLNPRALKNKNKEHLPVFWRSNKRAWVTIDVFMDWFHNCFIAEVKRYLASKNLAFKVLLVLDNAPGHPADRLVNADPNVQVEFLPPNTTSLIQPLDQGAIKTYKAYYTRRTFGKILESMENDPTLDLKQCWKNYTIADCLVNIKESLDELKQTTLNACWRNLWPETVKKEAKLPDINEQAKEIATLCRNFPGEGFDNLQTGDIVELINSHTPDLDEDDLVDLMKEDENEEEDENKPEEPKAHLTSKILENCFMMASKLTETLFQEDPVMERSLKCRREIEMALAPYREIQRELKQKSKQTLITSFFTK